MDRPAMNDFGLREDFVRFTEWTVEQRGFRRVAVAGPITEVIRVLDVRK